MSAQGWWAVEDVLVLLLALTCLLWVTQEWRAKRLVRLLAASFLAIVSTIAVLAGVRVGVASGSSMAPTLANWNLTLVSVPWWTTHPAVVPGEVVVFAVADGLASGPEKILAKRVVAVEGQALAYQAGQLTIDGQDLALDWQGPNPAGKPPATQWKKIQLGDRRFSVWAPLASLPGARVSHKLGKGEVFVIGDHWAASRDSREFGPIPVKGIRGKVLAAWSWENGWTRL